MGRPKNYDLLSGFNYFVPSPVQIFALLLLFLGGSLIGSGISAVFLTLMPGATTDAAMLIAYPVSFIPAMIYAKFLSQRNLFQGEGIALDSNGHFGRLGALVAAIMVIVATFAAGFLTDIINAAMPIMPDWLEKALSSITQGNIIISFICASLFAPFFEEWLCRGIILRGLLNYKRPTSADGTVKYGIKPVWAIVISAAIFALIHMNPWQAVPAFILGCIFGYVYYRTGSLKLAMLMHFTNNTFSLVIGHIDSLKDYDNWANLLPTGIYISVAIVCVLYLCAFFKVFNTIKLDRAQGNCDRITI